MHTKMLVPNTADDVYMLNTMKKIHSMPNFFNMVNHDFFTSGSVVY